MNYSERIIIIGASQSGKTTFCKDFIIKDFSLVHYFGPECNIDTYREALRPGSKMTTSGNPMDSVNVLRIARKYHNLFPDKPIPLQLLIFDDVIDKDFIKTDACRQLFCAGRHLNLSIVFLVHSPTTVATPVMKSNCTQLVICQYYSTDQFNDLIDDFFKGMVGTPDMSSSEINKKVRGILTDTFKWKYGKLIIRPLEGTWSQWFPAKKELKDNANTYRPVIPWAYTKRGNKGLQEFEDENSKDEMDAHED